MRLILVFVMLIAAMEMRAQEFRELLPPENLRAHFIEDTLQLQWDTPAGWDSLTFDVYRAVVFDTSEIVINMLTFERIRKTSDSLITEVFKKMDMLSHLAFIYYVVAVDENSVESVRSYYYLIKLAERFSQR